MTHQRRGDGVGSGGVNGGFAAPEVAAAAVEPNSRRGEGCGVVWPRKAPHRKARSICNAVWFGILWKYITSGSIYPTIPKDKPSPMSFHGGA